jgi:hypothetical protein
MLGSASVSEAGAVRELLERGGTVFWFPPPETQTADLSFFSSGDAVSGPASLRWEESSSPVGVEVAVKDAEVFGIFSGGQFGDPAAGEFTARFRCSRSDFPGGRVLLAYKDGVPALVEMQKSGTFYFWNLPLGKELSDWQNHAEYLILLGEMILHSRSTMPSDSIAREYVPGQIAAVSVNQQIPAEDVLLVDRAGKTFEIEKQTHRDGVHFVSDRIKVPGTYTWKHKDVTLGYSIFNFPVTESDLRGMSR